ncbi:MAG: hypothetical protein CL609_16755 [Anaerolineaceae bacterium]|nr:hypothetical protein [Anaerolineaceae bacterium]
MIGYGSVGDGWCDRNSIGKTQSNPKWVNKALKTIGFEKTLRWVGWILSILNQKKHTKRGIAEKKVTLFSFVFFSEIKRQIGYLMSILKLSNRIVL